jgi:hypothetical protein
MTGLIYEGAEHYFSSLTPTDSPIYQSTNHPIYHSTNLPISQSTDLPLHQFPNLALYQPLNFPSRSSSTCT